MDLGRVLIVNKGEVLVVLASDTEFHTAVVTAPHFRVEVDVQILSDPNLHCGHTP